MSELCDADIEALAREIVGQKSRSYVWAAEEFAKFILQNRQIRATLPKVEKLETGLILPGWFCDGCQVFNGEAKEKHTVCRCCGLHWLIRKKRGG